MLALQADSPSSVSFGLTLCKCGLHSQLTVSSFLPSSVLTLPFQMSSVRALVFSLSLFSTMSSHGYTLPHFAIGLEAWTYIQIRVTSKLLSFICIDSFWVSAVGSAL